MQEKNASALNRGEVNHQSNKYFHGPFKNEEFRLGIKFAKSIPLVDLFIRENPVDQIYELQYDIFDIVSLS